MSINIHFLYIKAYLENLLHNGPVVSEKKQFCFSSVNDLEPKCDLDIEYLNTFIQSITYMHLPTSRSQTAMFSFFEKLVSKFDLAVK